MTAHWLIRGIGWLVRARGADHRGVVMTERQMVWTIIGMWALVGISLLCLRMGWT